MKLILLGAPGAGKGTQSEILSNMLNVPTVATGNILRAAMVHDTPRGRQVKAYMNQGVLVPDDIIMEILRERLAQPDCAGGFILDGVPRTMAQALSMEQSGITDGAKVVAIEVTDEEVQRRTAGRRVCINCGRSYHIVTKPPKAEGICDFCGGELIHRRDDAPEMARQRLELYRVGAEPLKEFYRKRDMLVHIYTKPTIEETTRIIVEALGI